MSVFWFRTMLLALVFGAAAISDRRRRKISNHLLAAAAFGGVAYRLLCGLPLAAAFLTAAVLLGIGILLYMWRLLGAGDGKLLALSGLYYGWPTWWGYGSYLWFATLVIGVVYLMIEGCWRERARMLGDYLQACLTAKRLLPYPREAYDRGFPFAICMACAFLLHTGRGVLIWLGSVYVWRI